jgi:hypothetical protein
MGGVTPFSLFARYAHFPAVDGTLRMRVPGIAGYACLRAAPRRERGPIACAVSRFGMVRRACDGERPCW